MDGAMGRQPQASCVIVHGERAHASLWGLQRRHDAVVWREPNSRGCRTSPGTKSSMVPHSIQTIPGCATKAALYAVLSEC